MPEKLNLKINGGTIKRQSGLTLQKLTLLIKEKKYPESIEAQLIKMATAMPVQNYDNFAKNIYKYLKKCLK